MYWLSVVGRRSSFFDGRWEKPILSFSHFSTMRVKRKLDYSYDYYWRRWLVVDRAAFCFNHNNLNRVRMKFYLILLTLSAWASFQRVCSIEPIRNQKEIEMFQFNHDSTNALAVTISCLFTTFMRLEWQIVALYHFIRTINFRILEIRIQFNLCEFERTEAYHLVQRHFLWVLLWFGVVWCGVVCHHFSWDLLAL